MYADRWADPWNVTLEVPTSSGAPRRDEIGSVSLSSESAPCIVDQGVTSRAELYFSVGGGSYEVDVTLQNRVIVWEFVEMDEGYDPRVGGPIRRRRGRVRLPSGVASDGFEVLCRDLSLWDGGVNDRRDQPAILPL